jgi:hypothetical protein
LPQDGADIDIITPKLLHFDAETRTQILSDFLSTDLKSFLKSHVLTPSQTQLLGLSLGTWLASLHGSSLSHTNLQSLARKNATGRNLKYSVNAGRLIRSIDCSPAILGDEDTRRLFEDVAASGKEEFEKEAEAVDNDKCIIHGDFWPGNVLLPDADLSIQLDKKLKLMVVDWELCHWGYYWQDIGQLLAEIFLAFRFNVLYPDGAAVKAYKAFLGGFEEGYDSVAGKKFENGRVLVSMGIHLIVWTPSTGWGTEEEVAPVIRAGKECIRRGWSGELNGFVDVMADFKGYEELVRQRRGNRSS